MASAQTISRKTFVGAIVIGIHVLFGLALIAGTAVKYVPQISDLMNIDLIKHEEEPTPKEPPPPPPDFKPPPVQPPPSLDLPVVTGPPIATAISLPKAEPPKPAPAPAAPPQVVQARIAKGSNLGEACSSYYPSASRRLSEEGSVVLLIYIAPNGRVSETKVETSSGIQRLDEAAEKCVKAQGKFEPSHVGNEAVGSWQRMKWTWRLTS